MTLVLAGLACALPASHAQATPQFARAYRVECSHCHASPPRLNDRGVAFAAAGYRLREPRERRATVPLAVWSTLDVERRHSADFVKAHPSRIELISAGHLPGGRSSYFAEWRALSRSLGSDGSIVDRSGRFEDLFVRVPVMAPGSVSLTAGQFRALAQVDVSLRLSLSEPLALSGSVPAAEPARSSRLTALRGFSAAGRQPALRIEYQRVGATAADGWVAAATLPMAGELTIPFTEAASFEFEARPKGVFFETFRRTGVSSFGGHVFLGEGARRIGTLIAAQAVGRRAHLLGAVGEFRAAGISDTRFSLGGEFTILRGAVAGVRVDHRTGPGRDPTTFLYANGHLPFGSEAVPQALRVQVEHRVQQGNHATALALSHVF